MLFKIPILGLFGFVIHATVCYCYSVFRWCPCCCEWCWRDLWEHRESSVLHSWTYAGMDTRCLGFMVNYIKSGHLGLFSFFKILEIIVYNEWVSYMYTLKIFKTFLILLTFLVFGDCSKKREKYLQIKLILIKTGTRTIISTYVMTSLPLLITICADENPLSRKVILNSHGIFYSLAY